MQLKRRNIRGMNDLYNFQNMIILCLIFESRVSLINEKYKFYPRSCNSVSTFGSCLQSNLSKVIIALPAGAETVELFEETLVDSFSCIKIKLRLDNYRLRLRLS